MLIEELQHYKSNFSANLGRYLKIKPNYTDSRGKYAYNNDMLYWLLPLIFFATFFILIAIVLAVGIDFRLAINVDNDYMIFNCYILKRLFLLKVKVMLYNGEFFVKLGSGAYRTVEFFKSSVKENDLDDNVERQDIGKTKTSKAHPKTPSKVHRLNKIVVHNLNITAMIGVEDNPILSLSIAMLMDLFDKNLSRVTAGRVATRGITSLIHPITESDSAKINLSFNLKWSFVVLLSRILSIGKVKERKARKSAKTSLNESK